MVHLINPPHLHLLYQRFMKMVVYTLAQGEDYPELDGKVGSMTIYDRVLSATELLDNHELHKNDY